VRRGAEHSIQTIAESSKINDWYIGVDAMARMSKKSKQSEEFAIERPPPLCRAVDCNVDIDVRKALEIVNSEAPVLIAEGGIYMIKQEKISISPSIINDLEFCERLVWVQNRLKAKLATEESLRKLVLGRLLHERYGRFLSQYSNVVVEYRVEIDDLVGVVDAVIFRESKLIPVELKTGYATREAHRKQLQMYMHMLGSSMGYLVYRDRVEVIKPNPSVLGLLNRIKSILISYEPPTVDPKKCSRCPYRRICWSPAVGGPLSLWL